MKGALDDRELRRIDTDLDALARLQRTMVAAGPSATASPEALAAVQGAMLAGVAIEFDYRGEDAEAARWRQIVPYGLVHGPVTYVVGAMSTHDRPPVYYRLDRMADVRASNMAGLPPADWNLDAWLRQSSACGARTTMTWCCACYPPACPAPGLGASIRRSAGGGRRHPADPISRGRPARDRRACRHQGGEVVIEGPEALRAVMRERLAAGAGACG